MRALRGSGSQIQRYMITGRATSLASVISPGGYLSSLLLEAGMSQLVSGLEFVAITSRVYMCATNSTAHGKVDENCMMSGAHSFA